MWNIQWTLWTYWILSAECREWLFGWHDNPLPKWKYAIRLKWIENDQHRHIWQLKWMAKEMGRKEMHPPIELFIRLFCMVRILRDLFEIHSIMWQEHTHVQCSVFGTHKLHTETTQQKISKRHFRSFVCPPFDDYTLHTQCSTIASINRTLMITFFFLFPRTHGFWMNEFFQRVSCDDIFRLINKLKRKFFYSNLIFLLSLSMLLDHHNTGL